MPMTDATSFEISHKGDVREQQLEAATEKLRSVAGHARERIRHVELRLTLESGARSRPAMAEATLDVDGQAVRAHESAETVPAAVDLLMDRLTRRLRRHEDRRHRTADRHRTGDSGPGEWRHGDLKSEPPEYLQVDVEDREVKRHKTVAGSPMSVEEAAFDLDLLGHSFYLFVDAETGSDAALATSDSGVVFQLIGEEPSSGRIEAVSGLTAGGTPPVLDLAGARSYLENAGLDHLFFKSTATGRGQVLYRRFDGHYGLVTST